MYEANETQYRSLANAIISAFDKGWDVASASQFILKDTDSLYRHGRIRRVAERLYSARKLAAMVRFESITWCWDLDRWQSPTNPDQPLPFVRYVAAVIASMVRAQPQSFGAGKREGQRAARR
jgi:hypothetical protein